MRWTRSKPFGIIICTMTMTLVHLTLLVLIMILPLPFTWFHFFHVQTATFSSNDENTRSRWLCLLECISSSIVIVCSALLCFFYSWPLGVWWKKGPVIYYLHALNRIDMCVPFLVCSWRVLGSGESVFWVIDLSVCLSPVFFLKFLILMTMIFKFFRLLS